ncbi:unnamed protein product [Closterium sp. Naga37s-1]|nr:unnamed protein product [Closterium sp. Naga37s-1]
MPNFQVSSPYSSLPYRPFVRFPRLPALPSEDRPLAAPGFSSSAAAVAALARDARITAVVVLEEEGSYGARGTGWEEEKRALQDAGLVAVWVPIRETDSAEQAAMLPQAVRVVAALTAMGHRVLLRCPSAARLSPLIALGYLVLAKGMPVSAALAVVKESRPNADPPVNVLMDARERLLAGMTSRVITIAEAIYHTRCTTGQHGDSQSDWAQAQEQCSRELFDKWLLADVSFARSVAQEANARVETLSVQLAEAREWLAELEASSSQVLADVASRTAEIEALKRREALWEEELEAAKVKEMAMREQLRVKQTGGVQQVRVLGEVEEEISALRLKVAEGEERNAEVEKEIGELRAQVDEAKGQLRNERAVAEEAEERVAAANEKVREEVERAARARAAAWTAAQERRAVVQELAVVRTGRKEAAARAAAERIEELQVQAGLLAERVKQAEVVSVEADSRAGALEAQMAVLVSRTAAAQQRASAAAARVTFLSGRFNSLEMTAAEAARRAERVESEVLHLRGRDADAAAAVAANAEAISRLSLEVSRLSLEVSRFFPEFLSCSLSPSPLGTSFTTAHVLLYLPPLLISTPLPSPCYSACHLRRPSRPVSAPASGAAADQNAASALRCHPHCLPSAPHYPCSPPLCLLLAPQAMHLKDSEAAQAQREAALSVHLPAAQQQGEELRAQAAAFSVQLAAMARHVTGLKAELDWVDAHGRRREAGSALSALSALSGEHGTDAEEAGRSWSLSLDTDASSLSTLSPLGPLNPLAALAPLAAVADAAQSVASSVGVEVGGGGGGGAEGNEEWVRREVGVQGAAVAAEGELEGQMEGVEDPLELLKVLMDRVSEEASAITQRSAHLVSEAQQLREELDAQLAEQDAACQVDGRPLREVVGEVEQQAAQQREELLQQAGALQWALGGSLALAVVAPLAIYNSYFSETARSNQINTLSAQLDAATQASRALEQVAGETEAESVEAMARLHAMEAEVEAQRAAVTRLQSLVPLVAPSVESDEAARFCQNVPQEFQSPITEQICDGLRQSGRVEAKRGDGPSGGNGAAQGGRFGFNNPFNLGWKRW